MGREITKEPHRESLKVVSYNIHKGFNSGNLAFVLKKMKAALIQLKPDLVFLQEVLGEHELHQKRIKDWPEQSQFEFLAEEIWPHYAYGKNAVYAAGHHGNAVLSKYPLLCSENLDISTNPWESRGLLHAWVEVPGSQTPLHALCVHLGLREMDRLQQIQWLCERVESHVPRQEPLILGGDFNDWRERASGVLEQRLNLKEVFQVTQGAHARSFPSWLPTLRLDRIYVRGLSVKNAHCFSGKPWSQLSDHSALASELVMC